MIQHNRRPFTEEEMYEGRIFGCVFGQAIGDAVGHPLEAQSEKTRKVEDLEAPYTFTDDTQMFCALGEALLEAPPHKSEEEFMKTLGKKFDEWRHSPLGGSHRAPGGNCMDAVRRLGAGVHWQKSGGLDSKGNGSAMRAGIVGARYWRNPEYAFRIGCLTSVPTHNNLEPILASGVVAYLTACGIARREFPRAFAEAMHLCADFENPYVVPYYPKQVKLGTEYSEQNPWYAVARFAEGFALGVDNTPACYILHKLGDPSSIVKDGAAVPATAEAIYFATRYPHDFQLAVLEAANNSDDTDTIAAITGTILGSYLGYHAIPEPWLNHIELSTYLASLAFRTFQVSRDFPAAFIHPPKDAIGSAEAIDLEGLLDNEEFMPKEKDDDEVTF